MEEEEAVRRLVIHTQTGSRRCFVKYMEVGTHDDESLVTKETMSHLNNDGRLRLLYQVVLRSDHEGSYNMADSTPDNKRGWRLTLGKQKVPSGEFSRHVHC